MHHISKATAVITFPARTAFAVASAGVRTTVRLVGWAAEQAAGQAGVRTAPAVVVPEPRPAEPRSDLDVDSDTEVAEAADPMEPTREAPVEVVAPLKKAAAKKAPARKVPASQVPLKSAPTPSLPAGIDEVDGGLDDPEPVPARKAPAKKAPAKKAPAKKAAAKKTPAKKAAAKKAPARKAPSKQAAVLAPALGLSEDEVAEVVESDTDQA
ncbi:hypothetical protein L2K70_20050 [Nocardioides KLBMP 9356]|uniref:Uncharacterized protein n=1 Tax=Nocardioides potassii TaxID=2911371 RepID=A0ABS9HFJ5_9ACTN|nr:hypothetical protein [Nocardioides potassii]MCF6379912.1 hypothetical protein [Nocardioides potassii]